MAGRAAVVTFPSTPQASRERRVGRFGNGSAWVGQGGPSGSPRSGSATGVYWGSGVVSISTKAFTWPVMPRSTGSRSMLVAP